MSRKSQLSAEDRKWCIDHFHEFTHREMADRFGVSISTIRNMLHKAGCCRTKEETHRFRAFALPMFGLKRRRLYKMERFRAMSGLPRQTRLWIAKLSHAGHCYKFYMKRRFDYFYAEDDASVLCYDDQTQRSAHAEARAAAHGIKVVPADE